MKRFLLIMAACFPVIGLLAADVEPMPADTVIRLEDKKIEVKESGDRLKVKVYELSQEGDFVESEQVFEGHYRDGKSYERRKHMGSINIPFPTWDKDFSAHWAGFGMGFANFSEDNIDLRSGNSFEYNLNFMEFSFPFAQYRFALVTGAGMRWSRYRLSGNQYVMEGRDGFTGLYSLPKGMVMKTSKLNITSITIPLLLEWQPFKHVRRSPKFFVSAGVVGVVKTVSSSRIVYFNEDGRKKKEKVDTGMNLRPVSMDFLFQVGTGCIGVFGKYSPIGLFESGKGPKVHPYSIGLQLHI